MKYLLMFFEIILSPITFLFRTNLGNPNNNKSLKPLAIFIFALIVTAIIILMFYFEPLFGIRIIPVK